MSRNLRTDEDQTAQNMQSYLRSTISDMKIYHSLHLPYPSFPPPKNDNNFEKKKKRTFEECLYLSAVIDFVRKMGARLGLAKEPLIPFNVQKMDFLANKLSVIKKC